MATTARTTAATTAETTTAAPPPAGAGAEAWRRRPRRGLKRTSFQVPKAMTRPVRALWQSASMEEQERAHRTAQVVLRTWLGKTKREDGARELGLSAVRLWQLSQQAVCGMVVGCLRQPRFRPRAGETTPAEESVGVLRKRIADLERELGAARRLNEVLREFPAHRVASGRSGPEADRGRKGRRRVRQTAAAPDGGAATLDGPTDGDGQGR